MGEDAVDSGGADEFDGVVEVFVPGELLVAGKMAAFFFEGGGDSLVGEEGVGIGIGEDAFSGDVAS